MRRTAPPEQLDNFAITQQVANDARETKREFKRLDARIVELEAFARWALSATGQTVNPLITLSRIADEARKVVR